MKQLEPFYYDVDPGETVQLDILPEGVSGTVLAEMSGKPVPNVGTETHPRFIFTADTAAVWHTLQVWYHFPPDAENDAVYRVVFTGEDGSPQKDLPVTNGGAPGSQSNTKLRYNFRVMT